MAGAGNRRPGPVTPRVEDPDVDRALRSLDQRVRDLEGARTIGGKLLAHVTLLSGTRKAVYHGLGREVSVFVGAYRDTTSSTQQVNTYMSDPNELTSPDRKNYVIIGVDVESGGTATEVTLDLWVM